MTTPTFKGPPVQLAELVKTISGYSDAMDVRWQEIGWPAGFPERLIIVCGCQVRATAWTASVDVISRPIVAHVELQRKRLRLVDDGPHHFVWVGRCSKCRTIYWSGPVKLPETQE